MTYQIWSLGLHLWQVVMGGLLDMVSAFPPLTSNDDVAPGWFARYGVCDPPPLTSSNDVSPGWLARYGVVDKTSSLVVPPTGRIRRF